ncbi:MAG: DUF4405 domain-containing protein [Sulfurovum sp.]|nr:DUF4405 domain-containing protein [Sulfurovum sp.]MDD3500139.1 DUF4405 domain-containing protein [Sulfurovum sp.]
MTKNTKREMATSFTATLFLIMGSTGVMMYFHILDTFTKNMHEILGLAFVAVVVFHVFYNWNSMKRYFSKKVFVSAVMITLVTAMGFIATTSSQGENPKKIMIEAVLASPIEDAVAILGSDMETVERKLKRYNLSFSHETSLMQLAKKNGVSPFKIVSIITNE